MKTVTIEKELKRAYKGRDCGLFSWRKSNERIALYENHSPGAQSGCVF